MGDYVVFARQVADRMQAHFTLTGSNILCPTWRAAGILSLDAAKARQAAMDFKVGLVRPREEQSPFEQTIADNPELMLALNDFVAMEPPTKLWKIVGVSPLCFDSSRRGS